MFDVKKQAASIITAEELPAVLDAALALVRETHPDWPVRWVDADYAGDDKDANAEWDDRRSDPRHAYAHVLTRLNRDINEHRAKGYGEDMLSGRWWFTPNPIVISEEGFVIDGQHRIVAYLDLVRYCDLMKSVEKVDVSFVPPKFVLVTGVEDRAALLMDEARRTAADRRTIAVKFAA